LYHAQWSTVESNQRCITESGDQQLTQTIIINWKQKLTN